MRCVWKIAAVTGGLIGWMARAEASPPLIPYATPFLPGSPSELALVVKNAGTTVVDGSRHAEKGQFWLYGFPVAPEEACLLSLTLAEPLDPLRLPAITVLGADNKPLPVRVEANAENAVTASWRVPLTWPLGSRIRVVLSAKLGAFTVRQVRFIEQETDSTGDGLPDYIARWMAEGLPSHPHPTVLAPPSRPYTVTRTSRPPDPSIDLQTDAVFANTPESSLIAGWKSRGYAVWNRSGSGEGKDYSGTHPDAVQKDAAGRPIVADGKLYVSPTEEYNRLERSRFEQAVGSGSTGVCTEEPEYWARAGYEGAFRLAWKQQFGTAWQDPASSLDARWKASLLMAKWETDHVAGVLQPFATGGNVRRMVALHSTLDAAELGIVSPPYALTQLPAVQDVLGQVGMGTASLPSRYAGVRSDRTFARAYLEYSSLAQLLRGTGKRLWFLTDPVGDDPTRSPADVKAHAEETLIAALLFPEIDAYEVTPWPERVYGHVPADYAAEIGAVTAALQDMHNQRTFGGNATAEASIGAFVSDTMQWQRQGPAPSDIDGFFGLTLPLLQRGVPIQAVSLERAAEPGYLRPFKTLLLTYDYQKPLDPRLHAALNDWVRRGGSLVFFGGSDPYNALNASWWRQASERAPQEDLWKQLGVSAGGPPSTRSAAAEDAAAYRPILRAGMPEQNLGNRRSYALDLTPFAQETGSAAVRFANLPPGEGHGAWVASAELRIGGVLAASFTSGSDIESRFLVFDHDSQFNGQARSADGNASWTYQFDNLPAHVPITLTVDMGNRFLVSAASVKTDFGHTLLSTGAVIGLDRAFPRLRIGAAYAATIYPGIHETEPERRAGPGLTPAANKQTVSSVGRPAGPAGGEPTVLYTLREGGAPVWMQHIGKGLVLNVGVAPGFFSASERSAGLLRALVQYAHQRAGGSYREPGSLRLQRGRYTIVRTFSESEDVDGRTIDLLSPSLAVAEDRTIPPHSLALLYDLGSSDAPPHVGFVSGRMQAKLETNTTTAWFARGPSGVMGQARLHSGGRSIAGIRAIDHAGRPVTVQSFVDGGAVLFRYPNDPDGIAVRVGWQ